MIVDESGISLSQLEMSSIAVVEDSSTGAYEEAKFSPASDLQQQRKGNRIASSNTNNKAD